MKIKFFPRSVGALIFLVGLAVTGVADEAPAWMRQAAAASVPAYDKDVKAVVLHKEEAVTLESNGNLVTTERYAVRILSREGRREAVGIAFYLSNFGKIREMEGWLIAPGGSTRNYGKKEIIDQISDMDDVYNEGRIKVIDASGDADAGYVFGYTVTSEEKPLFYQAKWSFQDNLPTLFSRFTLSVPQGWKASSITFNRDEVSPQVSGQTYSWELRNLPPIQIEPMSPTFQNLAPRIAVNYFNPTAAAGPTFADWTEVSRWTSAMYDPQVVVDDAVAGKARELTASAKNELEIIRAIGSYVQNLQYISIDIGVGYGNGMRPRSSSLVISRGYGDCKDKANLMRAMLRSLKIDAYPVAIYSGDPTFVRKEWASPGQFNHAIIAIRVSDSTSAPTIMEHAKLGRLLIFDATDQFTPVGDLPDSLQGSNALIIAGENGGLVQMPVTTADFNAWKRETEVTLAGDGSISGVIRERVTGQESRYARSFFRSVSANDFNKTIEGWLSRGAGASRLIKLSPRDRQADASFDMDVEFSAARYGQLMQDKLLVFKPVIVNRTNSIYLTEKTRTHPVMLDSNSFTETVVVTLPTGFVVDEMPTPVSFHKPFGKYSTTYEVKDGKLFFTRTMTISRTTVPVEKYSDVREFFTKILDAEQSPVVLLRK
jgi:hypothetical protein